MVSDFTECCRLKPKTPQTYFTLDKALGIIECSILCAFWTESMEMPLSQLHE